MKNSFKIPKIEYRELRSKEKKELMAKITVYIGYVLQILIDTQNWKPIEISRHTGVPPNRISEVKDFKKYKRPINDVILILFIKGGIVDVRELMERTDLTKKERAYLEKFLIYQDKDAAALAVDIYKMGYKVSDILKEWLDRNK